MKYTYPNEPERPRALAGVVSAIESVLFASGEPVVKASLAKALGIDDTQLEEALEAMRERYEGEWSGLMLSETDESVQLKSKPENHSFIEEALSLNKRKALTKASAEVLAIAAYNGPVTRVDIDAIRGVNSAGALTRLVDQGLIEECGTKDAPGRPRLYRVSEQFLRLAGVGSLKELPSFESFNKRLKESEVEQDE